MVTRHHLAHRSGLAGIEQNEVFDNVQQPVFRQHAVEQHLGGHAALVLFVQPFPFAEVLPLAGDGAITGVVAIADDQKSVVMKRMGHDVFIKVITQIAIEPGTNVLVDRLELDEHQRQAVDEAHQIGAAVVVGRAQPGELEFAHRAKAVIAGVAKVDHRRLCMARLALRIPITHRYAITNEFVKRLVVLQQRARVIVVRQLGDGFVNRTGRQLRVEPGQRRPQVAHQHGIAFAGAAQRAIGAKGFLIPRVNAVPPQHLLQMPGKGGLYQAVFAVDVGVGHAFWWLMDCSTRSC